MRTHSSVVLPVEVQNVSESAQVLEKVAAFQCGLLHWYRKGRRRFSWRNGRHKAYEILIAELMLRKTDSGKVAVIYEGFIRRYPSTRALAEASEDDIRDQIRLLGISDRARLLHGMANVLLTEHGGLVPVDRIALLRLPGVGQYTANAVRCFAFRQDVPLLDTNIIRIIERVFSVSSSRSRAREDQALWDFAAKLVPSGKAISYNRALLDFGAQVCTHSHPKCETCSLQAICDYGNAQHQLTSH